MADSRDSRNPVVRSLQLLTTGWGYNFYDDKNRARADDLLIRERVGQALGAAVRSLSDLQTAYRQAHIPPITRENPLPAVAELEKLRTLERLKVRIDDLATRLRGASAPAQDRIWAHLRDERTLLLELFSLDEALIGDAGTIEEQARGLTVSAWHGDTAAAAGPVEGALTSLDTALRRRAAVLKMPALY